MPNRGRPSNDLLAGYKTAHRSLSPEDFLFSLHNERGRGLRRLRWLVWTNAAEDTIHRHFESYPLLLWAALGLELLDGIGRGAAYSKPALREGPTTFRPDFLLAIVHSDGVHYHIVELKRPGLPFSRTFYRNAHEEGLNEIANWKRCFASEEERARLKRMVVSDSTDTLSMAAFVTYHILAGRSSRLTERERKIREGLNQIAPDIRFISYDRLLSGPGLIYFGRFVP